jgi:hypothetical protein
VYAQQLLQASRALFDFAFGSQATYHQGDPFYQ